MKYAYSPFDDDATVNLIQFNISKFHRWTPLEKFDQRVRRHTGDTRPLFDVSHDKQIYVFGHGAPRSDVIEDCSGNEITIEQLAQRLFLDGMSTAQKKLKLHSCSGGVGGDESMAAKLKMALVPLGYVGITVYGYREDLSTTTTGMFNFKRGMSGARAKSIRVGF